MLVIAPNLVQSDAEAALPDGVPLFLWDNLVTVDNVSADSEQDEYPATNLANPATNQEWRAAVDSPLQALVTINVALNSVTLVDGVAFARHNFGSQATAITILHVSADSPPVETVLVGPQIPPNDEPLLFHWTAQAFATLRIELDLDDAATEEPRAAVLSVGKILYCQRSFVVDKDFTPPRFARKTDALNGTSQRGDFLGAIVISQYIEGAVFDFQHFTAAWYRTYFDPFVTAAQTGIPFFFAWQPDDYPYEITYAWFKGDPFPLTSPVTGRMGVSLKLDGIVE